MFKKQKRTIYRKFVRKFLYWAGYRYCKACRKFSYIKTVQDILVFEDEPPMFYHYECGRCGSTSPTVASRLTEDVVKSQGYENFNDYASKNLNQKVVA